MAGVPGLEPRTTEPESAVLPITPYPKGVSWPLRPKTARLTNQGQTLPKPPVGPQISGTTTAEPAPGPARSIAWSGRDRPAVRGTRAGAGGG
ncbi:hypothetical protein BN12_970004 [Nostocoides japonicum T1-X7]|uniref:Uncharacterized protein n=1 Tax=Nostocoides japonicum T1-X7 TaxID=1194083 RepID=A0A077M2C7_9MICO|nr:hypothetical protein BN12_970004 [Tetrasphaera japonica T1-X7]